MSDLIKREDAIKAVLGLTMYKGCVPVDSVIFNIKKIPTANVDRKTEPSVSEKSTGSEKPNNSTISKMEQVDKDINVRSKDEAQTCSVNGRPYTDCCNCEYFKCTADEPYEYEIKALHKDYVEPYVTIEDEPQTERSSE